jgi:hypothetical protein
MYQTTLNVDAPGCLFELLEWPTGSWRGLDTATIGLPACSLLLLRTLSRLSNESVPCAAEKSESVDLAPSPEDNVLT